jgi:hypothetical protein
MYDWEDLSSAQDAIDFCNDRVEVPLVFSLRPEFGLFEEAIKLVLPSSGVLPDLGFCQPPEVQVTSTLQLHETAAFLQR